MPEIRTYKKGDGEEVVRLVLTCQNDGTRPLLTTADQPDLLTIKESYQDGGGNFWVAVLDGNIIGSIGLMKKEQGIGILKKFFVYDAYRGKPYHVGQKLFQTLLTFAKKEGFTELILDTPKNTERAPFTKGRGLKKFRLRPCLFPMRPPIKTAISLG